MAMRTLLVNFTDLLIGFVGGDPRVLAVLVMSGASLLGQPKVTGAPRHILVYMSDPRTKIRSSLPIADVHEVSGPVNREAHS